MTDVVVVGGGITGLCAARDLAREGADVSLVEPDALGGKLRTSVFDGGLLDESADAFLARVPEGIELCRELGLDGELVSPAVRRAYLWVDGALRPLPEGHVLGVPTDLDKLAASGLLTSSGIDVARQDLAKPLVAPEGDIAIGALIRDRLGDEVLERLVDPLVGGINAGDSDLLSLAATVPQLDAAVRSGASSLMEACAAQLAAAAEQARPVFYAPRGGMAQLTRALADDAQRRGVTVVVDRAVGLERERRRWRVALLGGRALPADAVVVAAPAGVAAGLLRPHAPGAAATLADIPYASVALISLALDASSMQRELDGTGFLVPRSEGRTITACSWTSSKWPHLRGDGTVWLRASVGRDGDDLALSLSDEALAGAALADLADTMELRGEPREVRVNRWPAALPQYRPGHLERIVSVEAELASLALPVVVTGAALRGLGVPACIRQGRAAAATLADRLGRAS